VTLVFELTCLVVIALAAGFGFRKFARRVAKIADAVQRTSIARAQGFVEITGLARAPDGAPTTNPLTGSPCAWYQAVIESDGEIDTVDRENSSIHPVLLDDGTGACAVAIDRLASFADREVVEQYGGGVRAIRKILAGTPLFAIGRIERLAVPERGATHRLVDDPEMRGAVSLHPLERTTRYLPLIRKLSLGAFVLAGLLLLATAVSAFAEWGME
jgi:hypothetical protein